MIRLLQPAKGYGVGDVFTGSRGLEKIFVKKGIAEFYNEPEIIEKKTDIKTESVMLEKTDIKKENKKGVKNAIQKPSNKRLVKPNGKL